MSMLEMPVGTAHILSEKQKHDKQAYVILSGAKSNNKLVILLFNYDNLFN